MYAYHVRQSCLCRLIVLSLGFLLTMVAPASPLPDRHVIFDAGQQREFEIARDEVEVGGPNGPGWRIPGPKTAESVRERTAARGLQNEEVRLVLYERGMPRHEFTRRVLTREVAVRLEPGTEASRVMAASGAQAVRPVPGLRNWFLFRAKAVDGALSLADRLRGESGVLTADVQLARKRQKKLLPNDPLFSRQWHLYNTGQNGGTAGIDINVTGVWDTYRGAGILIGIVDDGLQFDHPDIAPNVNTAIDWDFNFNDPDPSPNLFYDTHGIAVAGIAGARGQNGLGVMGVAGEATLVALRLLGAADTDAQDAAALLHSNAVIQIKNNSWGAYDGDGHLEGAGPLLRAAFEQGTSMGRNGKGTIFVFAGGNGRSYGEDVNYDGFANSRHVIAVAAISDRGDQASYSEPGACVVVCAPSSSGSRICSGGRQAITTTDLLGEDGENYLGAYCELTDRDYTQDFTGTSAATPIVSGVIALMLEANPNLGYRDVKEILLRSATRINPGDSDWPAHAAGIPHNHKFGAGLVNAGAAVGMATNWLELGPLTSLSLLETNLNLAIPDNDPVGLTRTFTVTNVNFRVEHVTLTVTAPHTRHGDLAITLISPSGTASRLAERHSSSGAGYSAWTFNSVRHWAEHAVGDWTVRIADESWFNTGTLQSLELALHGSNPQAHLALSSGPDKVITLRSSAVGWSYAIEASTNLLSWEVVTTFAIEPGGQAAFRETNSAMPWRAYRARLMETPLSPSPE